MEFDREAYEDALHSLPEYLEVLERRAEEREAEREEARREKQEKEKKNMTQCTECGLSYDGIGLLGICPECKRRTMLGVTRPPDVAAYWGNGNKEQIAAQVEEAVKTSESVKKALLKKKPTKPSAL
jgi:hypothetical protein